ncbi:hypothetical protein OUZ56_011742 [Daphnia magna]|uniref:Uncharacterized protein n=1 Tax=Daphnia magna TaxID=35525 RepID=A0ABQ9Z106_9CRUS|nr:hypothetical protein OUZ56_011731 [Daphnia magna]KAK4006586.1 hypothetical protein OUZ56_011742 [Daphnia magna]
MNIGCVLPAIKLLKTTMLKFLDDETITHCRTLVEEDSVNEYINLLKGLCYKSGVTEEIGSLTQASHHQLRVSAYLAQPT